MTRTTGLATGTRDELLGIERSFCKNDADTCRDRYSTDAMPILPSAGRIDRITTAGSYPTGKFAV
jgi:hypothetical protein